MAWRALLAAAAALFSLAAFGQPVTPPPIAARAYYLLDALSGQALAGAAEDDRFEPASLTKLMTAYVAFTAIRDRKLAAAQEVKISPRAAQAGGGRMFVKPGQAVSVGDLLRGLIVHSGNDAALALADAVSGSEEAFVEAMN